MIIYCSLFTPFCVFRFAVSLFYFLVFLFLNFIFNEKANDFLLQSLNDIKLYTSVFVFAYVAYVEKGIHVLN